MSDPPIEDRDDAFVEQHDGAQDAFGKYLLLGVPNYNGAEGANRRASYLRLGAVEHLAGAGSPGAPRPTGEDLASKITSFVDDTRLRDGCPAFIPVEERQAETAKLHTRGGIRMHTDGNMVQTVRGDYVVVIGGHYKMDVRCRQPDGIDADDAAFEVSGGHVSKAGITFKGGGVIEYTTAEYNGTWMIFEDTQKSHVSTTYHGRVFDHYAGEIVDTVTGSETPAAEWPDPIVTNRTWAERLSSYTGSAAWPVPHMTDETWAKVLQSSMHAETMISETTVGEMTDSTTADSISSTTNVSGSIDDDTTADSINSTTTAGAIADTTTAGIVASTTTGNVFDTTVGNSMSTIIGTETEIILGNSMEVNLGAQESFTLGAVLDVTIGLMIDVAVSLSLSVDIGPKLEFAITSKWGNKVDRGRMSATDTELDATKVEANATNARTAAINVIGG